MHARKRSAPRNWKLTVGEMALLVQLLTKELIREITLEGGP